MLPRRWLQIVPVPTRRPSALTRTTTKGFVAEMRRIGVTPHVAQNTVRSCGSAIDGRTTRHEGYAKSIHARRGIEKVFGWI
jgi:hypothetical protein